MTFPYKGIEVYYELLGTGETVVLLHGFLESSAMWQTLATEFKHTHQVLLVDLPGHGETGCLGYIHSMEDMANMLIDLLEHVGIESAKFIGHSMGGYVALALSDSRPDLVDGLCLMNSTFEEDSTERQKLRQRSIEMAKTNYESLVRLSFSNLFAPESRITFKKPFEEAMNLALKTSVQGYIAAQDGMQLRANHYDSFIKINGPKAVVIGKKDTVVEGGRIKKYLENTPVDICELSGGHMSHIEDLYDLTYFLLHFIQK